jgi:hypothetical protein
MSTLKVNTIQNTSAAHSSTPEEIAQGRAKAWVNFNGSGTVAIQDNFNVSSITDNGTGNYTITYTNAMSDANYSAVLSYNIQSVNDRVCGTDSSNYLTTSMRVTIEDATQAYGNGRADCNRICVAIFGDQ